jgi:hypothetical protein
LPTENEEVPFLNKEYCVTGGHRKNQPLGREEGRRFAAKTFELYELPVLSFDCAVRGLISLTGWYSETGI